MASDAWLSACETFVTESVATHPVYRSSDGHGLLISNYNEDRFMGPLSICKYWFIVTATVNRPCDISAAHARRVRKEKYAMLAGEPHSDFGVWGEPTPAGFWSVHCDRYCASIQYDQNNEKFKCMYEKVETREKERLIGVTFGY